VTQTANQMGYSIPCDVMLSIQVGSWLKERFLLLMSKLSFGWWEHHMFYMLFVSIT